MGGIGISQKIYENDLYSPADNMFVYLYVTFGIFSLLIYYYIIKFINKANLKNENYDIYIYNVLFIIFAYGIVSNILEEPILCILFGSCIGYIFKSNTGGKDENINS